VNQDAGNPKKALRFPHENAILKPSVVAPIVGHETSKAQPECGLLISGMRLVVWMDCHNGHLPVAPVPCSLLQNSRISIDKKLVIGVDEAPVSLRLRNAIAKARPCLREEYVYAAQSISEAVVVAPLLSTISVT
jgi:hypothetical protein